MPESNLEDAHQKVCMALWNFKEQNVVHYNVTSSSFDSHIWLVKLSFYVFLFLCIFAAEFGDAVGISDAGRAARG